MEVTTPKGSAMVLMRLGDAAADLGPRGLQVHRSWWINPDHIAEVTRGANGPELRMSTGTHIPVGRAFRAAFDAVRQNQK